MVCKQVYSWVMIVYLSLHVECYFTREAIEWSSEINWMAIVVAVASSSSSSPQSLCVLCQCGCACVSFDILLCLTSCRVFLACVSRCSANGHHLRANWRLLKVRKSEILFTNIWVQCAWVAATTSNLSMFHAHRFTLNARSGFLSLFSSLSLKHPRLIFLRVFLFSSPVSSFLTLL